MATYSSTAAHRSGRSPSSIRPVNPVPKAVLTRPGASPASVVKAAAVTTGWRRLGTSEAGPRPMARVRPAARARTIHGSAHRAGES